MKLIYALCGVAVIVTGAVIFWQSSKPGMDFALAEKANTIEAYRAFLNAHPSDQRNQNVLVRIDELAWSGARDSNSIVSVEDYIRSFPEGNFIKEAKLLKDKLELDGIPVFEGILTISMGVSSGRLMKHLNATDGSYEVLTDSRTVYEGLEVSDAGVR